MSKKSNATMASSGQIIAQNSRAKYEYNVEETIEVGIVLQGTEVKSLRKSKVNLGDAHASVEEEEVFIHNLHIAEYVQANRFNHTPKRPRKLLLHKRQIKRLLGLVKKKGITLVPLRIYFNQRNLVKILLAVATGKKSHDRRETIKQREWERDRQRVLRHDVKQPD